MGSLDGKRGEARPERLVGDRDPGICDSGCDPCRRRCCGWTGLAGCDCWGDAWWGGCACEVTFEALGRRGDAGGWVGGILYQVAEGAFLTGMVVVTQLRSRINLIKKKYLLEFLYVGPINDNFPELFTAFQTHPVITP